MENPAPDFRNHRHIVGGADAPGVIDDEFSSVDSVSFRTAPTMSGFLFDNNYLFFFFFLFFTGGTFLAPSIPSFRQKRMNMKQVFLFAPLMLRCNECDQD